MTVALELWKALIAHVPCVLGARGWAAGCDGRVNQHHVAPGSSAPHEFSRASICEGHHTGGAGFHGMGGRAFCRLYRPPYEHELGLVIWTLEDLAKVLWYKPQVVLLAIAEVRAKKKNPSAGGGAGAGGGGQREG